MSALTVAEVLDGAADLLTPEGAWTQGTQACDADGNDVERASPGATCWCTVGAVGRVADVNEMSFWAITEALCFFREAAHCDITVTWNDAPGRTQAEVVAKLREAAALAREQQA